MVCITHGVLEEDNEVEYERTVGYLVYGVEVEEDCLCDAGIKPNSDYRVILVGEGALDKLVRETLEERLHLPNDGEEIMELMGLEIILIYFMS